MGITNNDSNSNEPHIIKYFEVFIVLVLERKVDQKLKGASIRLRPLLGGLFIHRQGSKTTQYLSR